MNPTEQLRHAQIFDQTTKLLNTIRKKDGSKGGKWAAIAIVHAAIFFLGRHEPRHQTYDWLQRICDDLVIDKEKW